MLPFGRLLYYQPHTFHSSAVFRAGGNDVDACRVDAAVTEDVGELGDVLFHVVEHAGKQMPQVVRKNLFGVDTCRLAQCFHFAPDGRPADGFSRAGHKDHPAFDFLLRCIAKQFLFQLLHEKDRPRLSFTAHGRLAAFCRLDGDIPQLAHAHARPADRLQNEVQPFIVPMLGGAAQARIFRFCQFLFFVTIDPLLQLQRSHPQIVPPQKDKEAVDSRQYGVDAARRIDSLQFLLIGDHGHFRDRAAVGKGGKRRRVADIFFDRCRAPFRQNELFPKSGDVRRRYLPSVHFTPPFSCFTQKHKN